MSDWRPVGREVSPEGLHESLVALVQGQARARVELGRVVDEFARRSGHHELGFSSIGAWALQRTGLSPRLVEESRSMARRLFGAPGLPLLAQALCQGRVSWSAAARVVPALMQCAKRAPERLPDEERAAIEAARSLTVRKLERWLAARAREWTERDGEQTDPELQLHGECESYSNPAPVPQDEAPPLRLLERTIDSSERELLEATRTLIILMDGPVSDEHFVEALLAEAHGSMTGAGQAMARALGREASRHDWAAAHGEVIELHRQARRRREVAAAAATEARVLRLRARRASAPHSTKTDSPQTDPESGHRDEVVWDALGSLSLSELESRALACARQLLDRDLLVADAALDLARVQGWRRLGWRNQDEYAREELGLSGSSLRAIIARARTMVELPELRDAVGEGRIGLEAAAAIGRVATPDTVEAWILRAERRTVVHLREEVRAVELLARGEHSSELSTDWASDLSTHRSKDLGPPTAAQLEAVREFERSVASGAWFEDLMASVRTEPPTGEDQPDRQMCGGQEPDRQMCGGLKADPGWRRAPRRGALLFSSAGADRDDHLRLRVSDEQAGWWRTLERIYEGRERRLARVGAEPVSFVAFACMAVWISWYPSIKHTAQYDRWTKIYVRDRYQCSSPVCSRRDVTPHHLRFVAHGGDDEAENVAALCSWCHLEGIHGGRITARPPASQIRWCLGRGGAELEVHGRELLA